MAATTTSGTIGRSTASAGTPFPLPAARSFAKYTRWGAYSTAMTASHTGAISTAKRANEIPSAGIASRLVRFETGSSSDAEFASRAHAGTTGRGLVRVLAAAAATTGVSSTTVASRLRVAVVTAAATNR